MNPPAPQMEFSIEPIIYFYTHSLFVIAVSAVVFMIMGIWIGHLTWAKYKRRARAYQEECDLLRHEIAALKRRIGESTAGQAPLVLINEDAPVPELIDHGPVLPGFELPKPALIVEPLPSPADPATPAKDEPHKESLASVVIGPAGMAHHTLEPVAPPDSIVGFSETAASPSSNGVHDHSAGELPVSPPAVASTATAKPRRSKTPGPSKTPAAPVEVKETEPAAELPPEKKLDGESPPPAPEPLPAKIELQPVIEARSSVDAQTAFALELADGTAVNDPTLGVLLRFQPERWDDLTLLRGVGEVLQQRLHDHGVHTFKQIAYWTDANVDAFSAKIEARDRIQREHWVGQARDMHFLKYGEKLA